MSKIKLTRPELKKQRDALQMFSRYLPTLKLKKQQLQLEVRKAGEALRAQEAEKNRLVKDAAAWAGLLSEELAVPLSALVRIEKISTSQWNIAGIKLPVLDSIDFAAAEYNLFSMPPWVDSAIQAVRRIVEAREKLVVLRKQNELLRNELKKVSQRVNLFEKVKIPEARENIRVISIFLGDEQAAAVGRAKIAKNMQLVPGKGND